MEVCVHVEKATSRTEREMTMSQMLKSKNKMLLGVTFLFVASLCIAQSGAVPKPEEKKPLSVFMRKKLAASSMILEGLAMEDFFLIEQGAKKLREMSKTEKWRVHNDPMYRQFSGEFQRITEKLSEAAKEEKLDTAALRWVDATMSCIECHQYVRKVLIADK